jgi:acetylornithine/succinyldiaminopimelate/putrescine aminotransferase
MKQASDLWSTHTANPISCAAAVAVLDIIKTKKLVEKTAKRDKWVRQLLEKSLPNYAIYGRGMIWGVYTGDVETTQKIITKCAEKGLLLVSTHGPAVKIGPPLTIPDEALREGIKVIQECAKEIEEEHKT